MNLHGIDWGLGWTATYVVLFLLGHTCVLTTLVVRGYWLRRLDKRTRARENKQVSHRR